jgi:hypothetical protein
MSSTASLRSRRHSSPIQYFFRIRSSEEDSCSSRLNASTYVTNLKGQSVFLGLEERLVRRPACPFGPMQRPSPVVRQSVFAPPQRGPGCGKSFLRVWSACQPHKPKCGCEFQNLASLVRHRAKGRPAIINLPQRHGNGARRRGQRTALGSMAVDRDVLAYVCYTPEQRTSVCRPELGRNGHSETADYSIGAVGLPPVADLMRGTTA